MMSYELLQEIADNWKLEAREEDNNKYFYNFREVSKLLEGQKNYVIGRKGTGKTAISEYIYNLEDSKINPKIFTDRLKFKNYPYNDLYKDTDLKYTQPNQYITLWKLVIYSTLCKMMLRNTNIKSEVKEQLSASYEPDKITSLPRLVPQWTSKDFQISKGLGGSFNSVDKTLSWISRVDILEDILRNYLDDSKYYIVFDELDEDYRDIKNKESSNSYLNLMTSLFKAVQDIRSTFKTFRKNIFPIIFLRDDIYGLIKDADKNKWSDSKIELDWDLKKIQRLLAFRISKANCNTNILPFNQAWNLIFSHNPVLMGNQQKKKMESFKFITRSTQLRPRDFIRYIQVCAEETVVEEQSLISPKIVRDTDKAFSNYLKSEIEDEIFPLLPDISNIFRVISEIRKPTLTINEFKQAYQKYVQNGTIQETNINLVLQLLYDFSVIGNSSRGQREYFRYQNKEARFNFNENITLHRGLYKALQIF